MARLDPEILAHLEWVGFVRPTGLVVSAPALVRAGAILDRRDVQGQRLLRACVAERAFDSNEGPVPHLPDFRAFAESVLGWSFSPKGYAGTAESPVPPELEAPLPDYGETLRPDYAVRELEPREGASTWQLIVQVLEPGEDFDRVARRGGQLEASAHGRMERLLRQTSVPAGVLFNGRVLRLLSAPCGESSGWLDFRVADMLQTAGRPISTALRLLLGQPRLLSLPRTQRLAALLEDSRKFQNEVSERLAQQVLHALYEFLRGFQAAHDSSKGELLRQPLAEHPDEVYRALLTVILRLVFLLYSEERDMLPGDDTFLRYYSLAGLYERLREDAALFPDTMDQRYGAWAQLLVLFRMIHDGAESGAMRLPERHGVLFDPDRFKFLEGRSIRGARQIHERIEPPLVPDGTIYRALEKLLVLDGERISYRALDVEQIGSVYETMMGFRLETATGRSVAIKAQKKQGAPTAVDLEALLGEPAAKREKWLQDHADRKLTETAKKATSAAATLEDLHAALLPVIDPAATPDLVPKGAMVLQPSEERRRSGSHYTPRSLTQQIVRTTLEPILERLRGADGRPPRPAQILDLKVCDPAMGSGAFLVEACRQLGDALVEAWHVHGKVPAIPPDEREDIFAMRLVAQRCLYGVDRNPVAVDLAKVSLWLVTLAKDHALTFVDHALRHGDSLVGLSRKQIEAFHWDPDAPRFQVGFETMQVREHVAKVAELRRRIREADERVSDWELRDLWDEAQFELDKVRLFGDLVLAAYFESVKAKERDLKRSEYAVAVFSGEADRFREWLKSRRDADPPFAPFHWQIELPEVFDRDSPGFDAVVGNPPFLNAIEFGDLRTANIKDYYAAAFQPFATGAYDLCLLFWARTLLHLLRQSGRYGLLSPTVLLSATTTWKQWMYENWRPDCLLLNPVDMFAEARIRTTAICGGWGRSSTVAVTDREATASAASVCRIWTDTSMNWYEVVHATERRAIADGPAREVQLADCAVVFAGCTTADAYDLKPLVEDSVDGLGPRLVTTGAIDRYSLKWGDMRIRYLKDDYDYPRWPVHSSVAGVKRAAQRQLGRKILVGGLTAVIEAWLDTVGDTAGIVQTWVIKPAGHLERGLRESWWYELLGILNSATFSRIFVNRHGAAAMSGKQITIKKQNLLEMPVPTVLGQLAKAFAHDPGDRSCRLPPTSEWHLTASSSAVSEELSRVVRDLLGLPTSSATFPVMDKLAHHLAGALYGRSLNESEDDYLWWCARAGSVPCERTVQRIVESRV